MRYIKQGIICLGITRQCIIRQSITCKGIIHVRQGIHQGIIRQGITHHGIIRQRIISQSIMYVNVSRL